MIAAATCLALVMYREARSEPIAAQIATAKILHHRAIQYQTPVCKELAKHHQFAWVRKYGITHPHPRGELDKAAWHQAKQLAKSVGEIQVSGISKKHIYFNSLALGKRYKTKTHAKRIGGLLFY